MNEGINEALKEPAVVELFARSGASTSVTTPAEGPGRSQK